MIDRHFMEKESQEIVDVGSDKRLLKKRQELPYTDKELADGMRALWIERSDGAEPFMGGDD